MFSKLPILSLIGLASLQTIRSQLTTATVFPGDSEAISSLQGQIEGTGKDGTTYVISGFVSSGDVTAELVTATLVEDATHLSELIVISTEGATAKLIEDCSYNAQLEGACTAVEQIVGPSITIDVTATATGVVSFDPVVLATGTAKSAASGSHNVLFLLAVPLLSLGFGLLLHA
ncbi:hypothetical protein M0805_007234 [Coniferiporia weirii]|nr:hypothetical protein M0805_007234 [Coniferiporia weirii]